MKNKNRYDMKRSEVDSFLDIMLVLYLFQVPCRIFFSSSLSFLPLGCCNQCFNTCLALYSSHPPPQLSMEQYFSLCCAITSEKINRNKHFHHQKKMYFLFRSYHFGVVVKSSSLSPSSSTTLISGFFFFIFSDFILSNLPLRSFREELKSVSQFWRTIV